MNKEIEKVMNEFDEKFPTIKTVDGDRKYWEYLRDKNGVPMDIYIPHEELQFQYSYFYKKSMPVSTSVQPRIINLKNVLPNMTQEQLDEMRSL